MPTKSEQRGDRVFLVKECPTCGVTEALISGDVGRYTEKRSLDSGYEYKTCLLNCLECKHRPHPTFVFVDVTNRCNLNCPICINNTPSMGFVFEPPIEYFEKIFEHFSHDDPPPAVQLFGGEPTVRKDLIDIIRLAKSYGFPTRVVTNGLKLADEDYCRELVKTKATILLAYDGANPETYRILRADEGTLELKRKALDNIGKIGGAKVALMTCVARDFNDEEYSELFELCHERRDYIRGVYFMPLVKTWDSAEFHLDPDRLTTEDIEAGVAACFPDEHVDFIPAGCLGDIPTVMKHFGIKPPPFRGAHPNCESMYLLISDGAKYLPLAHYLRGSAKELIEALTALEERLFRRAARADTSLGGRLLARLGLRGAYLSARGKLSAVRTIKRHMYLGRALKGKGIGKLGHGLAALFGLLCRRKSRLVLEAHTTVQGALQLIILPFEGSSGLETDRLERCPNAFAFLDPEDGVVKTVPVCAWGKHKRAVLSKVSDYYAAHRAKVPSGSGPAATVPSDTLD